MSNWTSGEPQVATEADLKAGWGGIPNGVRFRCYLCGCKFKLGDGWRWVWSKNATYTVNGKEFGVSNFMTCAACDGEDVLERWVQMNIDAHTKFWSFFS